MRKEKYGNNFTIIVHRVCEETKGQKEYLYSVIYYASIVQKSSDMDHTVLATNYTMSAFPS